MVRTARKSDRYLAKGIDVFTFSHVGYLLGISEEDVRRLIDIGDLKSGMAQTLVSETGTKKRNVEVITEDSYRDLAGNVILADNLTHELLNIQDNEETKPQEDGEADNREVDGGEVEDKAEEPIRKGTDPVKIPGYD